MLGILGSIFGSKAVVDKGLELIDDAFTSDEEMGEIERKNQESKTTAKIGLLNSFEPFKITQRFIAISFTVVFLFILINGVLSLMYGWGDIEKIKAAKDFANEMWLGEIMAMIVGWYFTGGVVNSFKGLKKDK